MRNSTGLLLALALVLLLTNIPIGMASGSCTGTPIDCTKYTYSACPSVCTASESGCSGTLQECSAYSNNPNDCSASGCNYKIVLDALPSSIKVDINYAVTVKVSGGTAPYSISAQPDTSKATVTIDAGTGVVTVTGVSAGTTLIIVSDNAGSTPVTIPITVGTGLMSFVTDANHYFTYADNACSPDTQTSKEVMSEPSNYCHENVYTCVKQGSVVSTSKFLYDLKIINTARDACPYGYEGDTATQYSGNFGKDPIQLCRLYVTKNSDGSLKDLQGNTITKLINDVKITFDACPTGYDRISYAQETGTKCLSPFNVCVLRTPIPTVATSTTTCKISSITLTPNCGSDNSGCSAAENVGVTVATTGSCSSSYHVQVDLISDNPTSTAATCYMENTSTSNGQPIAGSFLGSSYTVNYDTKSGYIAGIGFDCSSTNMDANGKCTTTWAVESIPQYCGQKTMRVLAGSLWPDAASFGVSGKRITGIVSSTKPGTSFTFGPAQTLSQKYHVKFSSDPVDVSAVNSQRLVVLSAYLDNSGSVYKTTKRKINFAVDKTGATLSSASCWTDTTTGTCSVDVGITSVTASTAVTVTATTTDPDDDVSTVKDSTVITFVPSPNTNPTYNLVTTINPLPPVNPATPGDAIIQTTLTEKSTSVAYGGQTITFRLLSGLATLSAKTCDGDDNGKCQITVHSAAVNPNTVIVEARTLVNDDPTEELVKTATISFSPTGTAFNSIKLSLTKLDGTVIAPTATLVAGPPIYLVATVNDPTTTVDTSYTGNIVFTSNSDQVRILPDPFCEVSVGYCKVQITGLSAYTVTILAKGDATNTKAVNPYTATLTFSKPQDAIAPTTTLQCSTDGTNFGACAPVYTSDVTIKLSCVDNPDINTGCQKTYYSETGANPVSVNYITNTKTFTKTLSGAATGTIYNLIYYSVDNSGNEEIHNQKTITTIKTIKDGKCLRPYEDPNSEDCSGIFDIGQSTQPKTITKGGTTTTVTEFDATITGAGLRNPALYRVCDSSQSIDKCIAAYPDAAHNNCGLNSACLCGAIVSSTAASCQLACYDSPAGGYGYYVLVDATIPNFANGLVAKYGSDISNSYTYDCPKLGVSDLDGNIKLMNDMVGLATGYINADGLIIKNPSSDTTAVANAKIEKATYGEIRLIAQTWLSTATAARSSLSKTLIDAANADYSVRMDQIKALINGGTAGKRLTIDNTPSVPSPVLKNTPATITVNVKNSATNDYYALVSCSLTKGTTPVSGTSCVTVGKASTVPVTVSITPTDTGAYAGTCTLAASLKADCSEFTDQDSKDISFTVSTETDDPITMVTCNDVACVTRYNGDVSVTLTCTDPELSGKGSASGCKQINYCTTTGCTPTTVYSEKFTITSSSVLRYYSQDNAGNKEDVREIPITIDRTVCGNNFCEASETKISCPRDCVDNYQATQSYLQTDNGLTFSTTLTPTTGLPSIVKFRVCNATASQAACKAAFTGSPASCGLGKSCLCGTTATPGALNCDFKCFELSDNYYYVIDTSATQSIVTDVKPFTCPNIGLGDLMGYKGTMIDVINGINSALPGTADPNTVSKMNEAKNLGTTWLTTIANPALANPSGTVVGAANTAYLSTKKQMDDLLGQNGATLIKKLSITNIIPPTNAKEGLQTKINVNVTTAAAGRYGLAQCLLTMDTTTVNGKSVCNAVTPGVVNMFDVLLTPPTAGAYSVQCNISRSYDSGCAGQLLDDVKTGTMTVYKGSGVPVALNVSAPLTNLVNTDVTITAQLLDSDNKMAKFAAATDVTFTTDFGTFTSATCTIAAGTSICTVKLRATSAGTANLAATTQGLSDTLTIAFIDRETVPPVTTLSCNGASCQPSYINNVLIELSCTDNSGCADKRYCIDTTNACTPATKYTDKLNISSAGINYIRFQSTDIMGNVESLKSTRLFVETAQCGNGICEYSEDATTCSVDCNGMSKITGVGSVNTTTGVQFSAGTTPQTGAKMIICDAAVSTDACKARANSISANSCGKGSECLCKWQTPPYDGNCAMNCNDFNSSFYVIASRFSDNRLAKSAVFQYSCPVFREQDLRKLLADFVSKSDDADKEMQYAIAQRAGASSDAERAQWDSYRNTYQNIKLLLASHIDYMRAGLQQLTKAKSDEMFQKSSDVMDQIDNMLSQIEAASIVDLTGMTTQVRVGTAPVAIVKNNVSVSPRYGYTMCTFSKNGTVLTRQSMCTQLRNQDTTSVDTNSTLNVTGIWNGDCNLFVSLTNDCKIALQYDEIVNQVSVLPPPNMSITRVRTLTTDISLGTMAKIFVSVNNPDVFNRRAQVSCDFTDPDGTQLSNSSCSTVVSTITTSVPVSMAAGKLGTWTVNDCQVSEAAVGDVNCTTVADQGLWNNGTSFSVSVTRSLLLSGLAPVPQNFNLGDSLKLGGKITNYGTANDTAALSCGLKDPTGADVTAKSQYKTLAPGDIGTFNTSTILSKNGTWTLGSCTALRKITTDVTEDSIDLSKTLIVFKPECTIDSQCDPGKMCSNQKCVARPVVPVGPAAECTLQTDCPGTIAKCSCTAGACMACQDGFVCQDRACIKAPEPQGVDYFMIIAILIPILMIGGIYFALVRKNS